MTLADQRYYYLPRRAVHTAMLATLVIIVALAAVGVALAPRWLPGVALALDLDVPLARADALVLGAAGQNSTVEQGAARLFASGKVSAIALVGLPFTYDVLVPEPESRRFGSLLANGVPRGAIVEVYEGDTIYEGLTALRDEARARGWRSVMLYGGSPGTRRSYLAANRILGEAGIQVGVTTISTPQFDPNTWWHDNRDRGRIVFGWLGLILGWIAGRY
jgi:hypothetical protein